MKRAYFYNTPIGEIGIAEENGAITNVFFGNTVKPGSYELTQTPLLKDALAQLMEYFAGSRKEFVLKLAPGGTAFEQAVWNSLMHIPYGQTRSYADIARAVNRPNACRAVGRANARNPISLFIPCHRVVGSNHSLTGYAGGIAAKEYLLRLEGARV